MKIEIEKVFVNLAVNDLTKTKEFFSEIGFEFHPQFTNELAACLILSENLHVMLLVEEHFRTFTTKEITDSSKSTEAIVALSVASKELVDDIVNKALAAGGSHSKEPIDYGFMYGWGFQDPDGHLWEVFFMDQSAMAQG